VFNFILLLLHIISIGSLILIALRFGKQALIALLAMIMVAMNFFTIKQIDLLGLHVTTCDALSVGYLLGLNLIQEVFGKKSARRVFLICLFVAIAFCLLSMIQLVYIPNRFDDTQSAFTKILLPSARLIFASLLSFVVVLFFDLKLFAYLREKTQGKFFSLRMVLSIFISECLDTFIFTFAGLWGLVHSLFEIAVLSLAIKTITIALFTPFTALSKRHISVFANDEI
jgi:queuosine precursor transporter